MVFEQTTEKTPPTKQLIINNTHLDHADDQRQIFYDDGIPDRLVFTEYSRKTDVVKFALEPIMVIGRKRSMRDTQVNVDLTPLHAAEFGVSHFHAMMLALDNRILIKDIESLNGMMLNGKRMIPSKEYAIDNGDILAFGNLEVKVRFEYD